MAMYAQSSCVCVCVFGKGQPNFGAMSCVETSSPVGGSSLSSSATSTRLGQPSVVLMAYSYQGYVQHHGKQAVFQALKPVCGALMTACAARLRAVEAAAADTTWTTISPAVYAVAEVCRAADSQGLQDCLDYILLPLSLVCPAQPAGRSRTLPHLTGEELGSVMQLLAVCSTRTQVAASPERLSEWSARVAAAVLNHTRAPVHGMGQRMSMSDAGLAAAVAVLAILGASSASAGQFHAPPIMPHSEPLHMVDWVSWAAECASATQRLAAWADYAAAVQAPPATLAILGSLQSSVPLVPLWQAPAFIGQLIAACLDIAQPAAGQAPARAGQRAIALGAVHMLLLAVGGWNPGHEASEVPQSALSQVSPAEFSPSAARIAGLLPGIVSTCTKLCAPGSSAPSRVQAAAVDILASVARHAVSDSALAHIPGAPSQLADASFGVSQDTLKSALRGYSEAHSTTLLDAHLSQRLHGRAALLPASESSDTPAQPAAAWTADWAASTLPQVMQRMVQVVLSTRCSSTAAVRQAAARLASAMLIHCPAGCITWCPGIPVPVLAAETIALLALDDVPAVQAVAVSAMQRASAWASQAGWRTTLLLHGARSRWHAGLSTLEQLSRTLADTDKPLQDVLCALRGLLALCASLAGQSNGVLALMRTDADIQHCITALCACLTVADELPKLHSSARRHGMRLVQEAGWPSLILPAVHMDSASGMRTARLLIWELSRALAAASHVLWTAWATLCWQQAQGSHAAVVATVLARNDVLHDDDSYAILRAAMASESGWDPQAAWARAAAHHAETVSPNDDDVEPALPEQPIATVEQPKSYGARYAGVRQRLWLLHCWMQGLAATSTQPSLLVPATHCQCPAQHDRHWDTSDANELLHRIAQELQQVSPVPNLAAALGCTVLCSALPEPGSSGISDAIRSIVARAGSTRDVAADIWLAPLFAGGDALGPGAATSRSLPIAAMLDTLFEDFHAPHTAGWRVPGGIDQIKTGDAAVTRGTAAPLTVAASNSMQAWPSLSAATVAREAVPVHADAIVALHGILAVGFAVLQAGALPALHAVLAPAMAALAAPQHSVSASAAVLMTCAAYALRCPQPSGAAMASVLQVQRGGSETALLHGPYTVPRVALLQAPTISSLWQTHVHQVVDSLVAMTMRSAEPRAGARVVQGICAALRRDVSARQAARGQFQILLPLAGGLASALREQVFDQEVQVALLSAMAALASAACAGHPDDMFAHITRNAGHHSPPAMPADVVPTSAASWQSAQGQQWLSALAACCGLQLPAVRIRLLDPHAKQVRVHAVVPGSPASGAEQQLWTWAAARVPRPLRLEVVHMAHAALHMLSSTNAMVVVSALDALVACMLALSAAPAVLLPLAHHCWPALASRIAARKYWVATDDAPQSRAEHGDTGGLQAGRAARSAASAAASQVSDAWYAVRSAAVRGIAVMCVGVGLGGFVKLRWRTDAWPAWRGQLVGSRMAFHSLGSSSTMGYSSAVLSGMLGSEGRPSSTGSAQFSALPWLYTATNTVYRPAREKVQAAILDALLAMCCPAAEPTDAGHYRNESDGEDSDDWDAAASASLHEYSPGWQWLPALVDDVATEAALLCLPFILPTAPLPLQARAQALLRALCSVLMPATTESVQQLLRQARHCTEPTLASMVLHGMPELHASSSSKDPASAQRTALWGRNALHGRSVHSAAPDGAAPQVLVSSASPAIPQHAEWSLPIASLATSDVRNAVDNVLRSLRN